MEYRISSLQRHLESSAHAFLITSDVNRFYFTGFSSSAGCVFITKNNAYLLVDFRYGEAAQRNVKHCKVIVFKRFAESIEKICLEEKIKEIVVEQENVTLEQAENYSREFNRFGVALSKSRLLDSLIHNLRLIKSSDEIAMIKKAQQITEEAYTEVLNYVKTGVTEREIALELEYLMRKKGADGVSFDLITITGANTSLPHGVPGDNVIKEGDFFLSDIGATYCGYHSDMTRTVAVGYATDEMYKVYNIVLDAQLKALQSVKAGVKCGVVDKTARDIIKESGYGENFGHSTGHGVGLDIHEQPSVYFTSDVILSSGMVITIEPGIYLPGKFGVRIEDMISVTKNGYNNFATIDKQLTII
ncbi:MAG: aminopeptidase P family protein [Acutalibacteraceae bacterium]|nr:aminopeptidase P family protein [Acutalibacteraceae bacterium]